MDINRLLQSKDEATVLTKLKSKAVKVPDWQTIERMYEGKYHKVNDRSIRPDKFIDGKVVPVSRIYLELEKLITSRMVEFMFAVPVKRVYSGLEDNPLKDEIYRAIEKVYTKNRINTNNIKRAIKYFASCEVCTLWYTVDSPNKYYGFKSDKKLKHKNYSQMEGYQFYPLFDEYEDLIAFSIQYTKSEDNAVSAAYFETYTDKRHLVWKDSIRIVDEENTLGKIPFIYMSREQPIYAIAEHIISEIEMTLSRNSDIIAYNSAPLLQIVGAPTKIGDEENKESSKKIVEVELGGSVSYVSWEQAIDSIKYQIDMLLRLIWMQVQLPDLSFENIKGLGTVSGEARKTLLTDAHLKVGDEKGAFLEFFDREVNLIKAYLSLLNPKWKEALEEVEVEHVITPFIQNDELNEIEKWVKASGGKQVMSQLTAIKQLGIVDNPDEEYEQINKEEELQNQRQTIDIFQAGE